MFSGIRSILFGYSEPNDQITEVEQGLSGEQVVEVGVVEKSSLTNDTSALLEQTLNAATTKFTEHLLPQSSSIEQLQLSSHQLLPTLIEQHEEEESKKKSSKANAEGIDSALNNETDDDESLNGDSWELLDLVEGQSEEAGKSLKKSTVQQEPVNKTTIGILKTQKNTASSKSQDEPIAIQQRQKPKVSFEAEPESVADKKKIEQVIAPEGSPDDCTNESTIKSKIGKKKRNKKGNNEKGKATTCLEEVTKAGLETELDHFPPLPMDDYENHLENTDSVPPKQGPSTALKRSDSEISLNYKAALSMKTTIRGQDMRVSSIEVEASGKPKVCTGLQTTKAVKRNRPLSTSSWSSSDEVEDRIWDEGVVDKKVDAEFEVCNWAEQMDQECGGAGKTTAGYKEDDDESIISSGFSDCDYGHYQGISDNVTRSKKSQKKRLGKSSMVSSAVLSSMSKRGNVTSTKQQKVEGSQPATSAKLAANCSDLQVTSNIEDGELMMDQARDKQNSSGSKSEKWVKPKKKRIVSARGSQSSGGIGKDGVEILEVSEGSMGKASQPNVGTLKLVVGSSCQTTFTKVATASKSSTSFMQPPPPPPMPKQRSSAKGMKLNVVSASNSSSGNDLSDVADMDESWFVTPPPCFTGSNPMAGPKLKAKEAAMENALIEHPSIYIAANSSSKKEVAKVDSAKPVASTSTKEPALSANIVTSLNKQKAIVLKKVSKLQPAPVMIEPKKKQPPAITENLEVVAKQTVTAAAVSKKNSAKLYCSDNKFAVNDWSCDDFDNLFAAEPDFWCSPRASKRASKAKKQQRHAAARAQKQQQQQHKPDPETETKSSANLIALNTSALSQVSTGEQRQEETERSDLEEFEPSMPALVGVADESDDLASSSSIEVVQPSSGHTSAPEENSANTSEAQKQQRRTKSPDEKRAPVQVQPLEPERQPGWQLRKKRSKRRPLSASMANTCGAAGNSRAKQASGKSKMATAAGGKGFSSTDSSGAANGAGPNSSGNSARSTPTLIDRIGSSIVANLTNLASGFPAAGGPHVSSGLGPLQARANMDETDKYNDSAVRNKSSGSELTNRGLLLTRRRMSKNYMDRENDCAKIGNNLRRADRRLKMHSHPNGVSFNRKVHTSFH